MMVRQAVLGALVTTALVAAAPASHAQDAPAIRCGAIYTVVPGDTLSEIAERAYGGRSFRTLFQANRDVLESPERLEIGDRLQVPCLDGAAGSVSDGRRDREEAARVRDVALATPPGFKTAPGGSAARVAKDTTLSMLVLGTTPPFAGADLPEGGMVTELVHRALVRAPVPLMTELSFAGLDGAEPDAVAEAGADLGFPAVRPDCANGGLGEKVRALCDGFLYSDPVYEMAVATFVTTAGQLGGAREPEDLHGERLCRPADEPTLDLVELGLVAPNVNPVRPRSAEDCMAMLDAGDVGVVSVPLAEGLAAIRKLGLDERVVRVSAGEGRLALRAVSPRANPRAEAAIALVNRGLGELRSSGEHAVVVKNHLEMRR